MATTTYNAGRSESNFLRSVQWGKAVQAGLIVGAVLFLLSRGIPWIGSGAIDPAIMGREVVPGEQASSALFLGVMVVHLAVAVVYALIIASIVNGFRPTIAGMVGGIIGVILYFLSYAVFGFFTEPAATQREWTPLLLHLAFGIITAEAYKGLARRPAPLL